MTILRTSELLPANNLADVASLPAAAHNILSNAAAESPVFTAVALPGGDVQDQLLQQAQSTLCSHGLLGF